MGIKVGIKFAHRDGSENNEIVGITDGFVDLLWGKKTLYNRAYTLGQAVTYFGNGTWIVESMPKRKPCILIRSKA